MGEVNSIKAFLSMQSPASAPVINPNSIEITAEDYVAPRFAKKRNTRQLRQKILESHANVKDLNLLESKMNFIRAWQSLPEYGISLFVVKYDDSISCRSPGRGRPAFAEVPYPFRVRSRCGMSNSVKAESGKDFALSEQSGYIHSCPTSL